MKKILPRHAILEKEQCSIGSNFYSVYETQPLRCITKTWELNFENWNDLELYHNYKQFCKIEGFEEWHKDKYGN